MAEEYQVLNAGAETEGGSEVPQEIIQDVAVIVENIQAIKDVADWINQVPNSLKPDIDGNTAIIQIRRDTNAGWVAADPILAQGEIGFITDVTPYAYKFGDGVSLFSTLPNAYDGADFIYADLVAQVAAAQDAKDDAAISASDAQTDATNAAASATSANDSVQAAADWAAAPVTTPLPGGKVSAEVSADRATSIASASRKVELRSPNVAANETMPASAIYKRTICNPSAPITITIPPNLFQDAGQFEAWALYRMLGAGGTVKFVPQGGGSDLQAPSNLIHQIDIVRSLTVVATDKVLNGNITLPSAVTAGKLLIQILVSFAAVNPVVHSCTFDNGLTATPLKVLSTPGGSHTFDAVVYEADIASLPAGTTINYQVKFRPSINVFGVCARVLTGQGATAPRVVTATGGQVASVSATISTLGAQWRVFAFAAKRGINTTCQFTGFSPNILLGQAGDSADSPDGDTGTSYRNMNYGLGNGVNNVDGNFLVTANFSSATGPPCLSLVAYPPKSVAGAGAVNLLAANGDTLTSNYSEAELFFAPNGKDVYMRILP